MLFRTVTIQFLCLWDPFKHKSTIHAFLKRLGSELLEEFFTEEEEVLSLIFPRASSPLRRLYRERVWYLDIIRINDLVNLD